MKGCQSPIWANQLILWLRKQFEEPQKMKWFDKVSESESQVLKFYLRESQFSFFPIIPNFQTVSKQLFPLLTTEKLV